MYFSTSTLAMTTALRRSLIILQSDLGRGQKELSTGRHADMAQALGLSLGRSLSLGATKELVTSILDSNKLASARLDLTQTALSSLASGAQDIRATLIAASNTGGDRQAIATQAATTLINLVSTLNGGDGASFLFGGVNSGERPVNDYVRNPPSPNKSAVDAAFVTAFGFAQNDPAVASITPAQMQSFLSGPMSSLFDATGWSANWSQASDQPIRAQIGVSEIIDASATANDPAMRKLAMAYVALSDLGGANMSDETWKATLGSITDIVNDAIGMLNATRTSVGAMQSAVNSSNDRMSVQSNVLEIQILDLESVEPAEAATRVNNLVTQIETSYALTARITQLSLTRFI